MSAGRMWTIEIQNGAFNSIQNYGGESDFPEEAAHRPSTRSLSKMRILLHLPNIVHYVAYSSVQYSSLQGHYMKAFYTHRSLALFKAAPEENNVTV